MESNISIHLNIAGTRIVDFHTDTNFDEFNDTLQEFKNQIRRDISLAWEGKIIENVCIIFAICKFFILNDFQIKMEIYSSLNQKSISTWHYRQWTKVEFYSYLALVSKNHFHKYLIFNTVLMYFILFSQVSIKNTISYLSKIRQRHIPIDSSGNGRLGATNISA